MFHENFEAPSLGDSVLSYSSNPTNTGWNLNNRLQMSGSFCDSAYIGNSDTTILTTIPFSTVGYPAVILSFNHICKTHFFDMSTVEASPDGGLTWIQLSYLNSDYLGLAPYDAQASSFSIASYGDWLPAFPDTVPTNAWWREEAFDVTNLLSNTSNAQIRFKTFDVSSDLIDTLNGWKIDDITLDSIYFGCASLNVSSQVDTCMAPQNISFNIHGAAIGYLPTDSVNAHIYFGDGTDSIFNIPIQTSNFNITVTHAFNFSGAYSSQVILTSPDGIVDTLTRYNIFLIGNNCGNISGQVYIDYNNDCLFNSGDASLKYQNVKLMYSGQDVETSFTDTAGNYSFYVPANPYTIETDSSVLNNTNLNILCPSSGFYAVSTVPSAGNDFALSCNPGFDLYSIFYLNRFRPNIQGHFHVSFGGNSCQVMSGIAKLVLDPMVSFVSSNPAPSSMNGDTLIWNFNNIHYGSTFDPLISILPSPLLNLGDSVCFTSFIEPVAGDVNTANNIHYGCAEISNSCDPNQKLVYPEGNISSSTKLDFMIEFQNVGNAEAYNIYILDTLNSSLDVNTLTINGASHNMTIDFLTGNVLKFNFNNIMLPDSGSNEAGSHGFVSYSIKPNSNLTNGTTISNTAAIYFDFNLPVITNTTINVIDTLVPTAISINSDFKPEDVLIYPNPVSGELKIIIPGKLIEGNSFRITIYNLFGEKILEQKNLSASSTTDLKNLAKGIYFYEITGLKGIIKKGKLIKM